MPDSVIKKLKWMGKHDKQNGRLTFAEDEEYKMRPLIDDNAVEPETPSMSFPDIPVEHPGILYAGKMPETTVIPDLEPPTPTDDKLEAAEDAASLGNADFGSHKADLLRRAQLAGVNVVKPAPPPVAPIYHVHHHNNINFIPAHADKVEDAPVDKDEDAPEDNVENNIVERYPDSSDDEDDNDYDPDDPNKAPKSEDESYKSSSEDDYGVETVFEDEALEDEPTEQCSSGCKQRAPDRLKDYEVSMLNAEGNEEESIRLTGEDVPYFGTILIQLSLKQGLKVFGKLGEAGAMKEIQQLHDMETFFPRDPKTLT